MTEMNRLKEESFWRQIDDNFFGGNRGFRRRSRGGDLLRMASDFGRLKSKIRASISVKRLAGLTDTEADISNLPLLKFR